jgi:hypothetical protein
MEILKFISLRNSEMKIYITDGMRKIIVRWFVNERPRRKLKKKKYRKSPIDLNLKRE